MNASQSRRRLKVVMALVIVVPLVGGFLAYRWWDRGGERATQVWAYFRDADSAAGQTIRAGERCGDAPFLMPTNGLIGFLWGDSFRPGHIHQGIDIFGGAPPGEVPVLAAHEGYLTRLPDWKSTVIIRIPDDPLRPGRQIWTYYTHMADRAGNSFISPAYPPGTSEVFVEAGTLLGYQGNFSGNPGNPTGVHLHFSVVRDDGSGSFTNELEIRNTYDPSPYFNLALDARTNQEDIPTCQIGGTVEGVEVEGQPGS